MVFALASVFLMFTALQLNIATLNITLKMCLKFIKLFKHELKTYTKRSMNITGNFLLKKKNTQTNQLYYNRCSTVITRIQKLARPHLCLCTQRTEL